MSGLWTHHVTADGKEFYFNSLLDISVWNLPAGADVFKSSTTTVTQVQYQSYNNVDTAVPPTTSSMSSVNIADHSKE